jgi:uncharacterized protein YceK
MRETMRKMILQIVCIALLAGCGTAQKATQPSGEWTPVNKPLASKG